MDDSAVAMSQMAHSNEDDANDAESIDQEAHDNKRRMHRTLPRVRVILEDDAVRLSAHSQKLPVPDSQSSLTITMFVSVRLLLSSFSYIFVSLLVASSTCRLF